VTVLGKDGKPKLTKAEIDEVQQRIRGVAVQAMQAALATAGNVPMSIRKRLQDLIEPKMDWRALLDSHLRSAQKDDYTFNRMSRRDWATGLILPAQDVLETVEVDIALDVSGSMTDEMVRDILSEVKGIMETFADFRLRVLQFDTKVYGFKEFTPLQPRRNQRLRASRLVAAPTSPACGNSGRRTKSSRTRACCSRTVSPVMAGATPSIATCCSSSTATARRRTSRRRTASPPTTKSPRRSRKQLGSRKASSTSSSPRNTGALGHSLCR
jgi:hypothetical protein